MGSIVPPLSTNVALTLKTDYCGNMIYENGQLSKILTDVGYITLANSTPTYHYYLQDHLGNNRVVIDEHGQVEQVNHYYAFGGLMGESTGGGTQPYKYNGKELDRMHGLDWYDYGTRYYDAVLGRWMCVDPLAENGLILSPYVFSFNNPIRYIDLDGRWAGDFVNEDGKVIGNDGINDNKVYLLKTTKTEFDSGAPSAGISKNTLKATIAFIKKYSGNTKAFQDNRIAYDNSVELPNLSIRQNMVNIVNQDDGSGGTADRNNREYGGIVRGNLVLESPMGKVGNPKKDLDVSITHRDIRYGDITFHSHPSGQIIERPDNAGGTIIGGVTKTFQWLRAPSIDDINKASGTDYEFSRGDGIVYIYNISGVQATIPQKRFITPKK